MARRKKPTRPTSLQVRNAVACLISVSTSYVYARDLGHAGLVGLADVELLKLISSFVVLMGNYRREARTATIDRRALRFAKRLADIYARAKKFDLDAMTVQDEIEQLLKKFRLPVTDSRLDYLVVTKADLLEWEPRGKRREESESEERIGPKKAAWENAGKLFRRSRATLNRHENDSAEKRAARPRPAFGSLTPEKIELLDFCFYSLGVEPSKAEAALRLLCPEEAVERDSYGGAITYFSRSQTPSR
jgi:hypothetical protein